MKNQPEFTGPALCQLSARETVALLRKGEVSPSELISAAFERIEATDGAVNAMVTTCWNRAEKATGALSTADKNHPGYLAGLPISIKDLSPVAGVRTTWGNITLKDFVPEVSDPLVTLLEDRAGVVIGKTNTPEFGAGGNTFNEVFGRTRNPWDTSKNAGGSSGGAAVSLATGQVWLAQGSDLAGSLRTPAAFCGVVGFRPSPGIAGGGVESMRFHTEAVSGPMARSVGDVALFLDAMSGFDPKCPVSFPPPQKSYQSAVDEAGGKVRIAFAPDLNGFAPVASEVEEHLRKALKKVEAAGGVVEETCPQLPHLDKTYRVLRAMLWAAGPGRAPEIVQKQFKNTLAENIDFGRKLTIDDVYDANIHRTALFENMASLLDDFDVLACPVVGLMPGPVEEEYPRKVDGKVLSDDYVEWLKFSFLSPTTLLPSVSVPVGLSDNGMPVGIQLIGPSRGEAKLLATARAFEVATGGPLGPIDPNITH